jgi:hypothetical protein
MMFSNDRSGFTPLEGTGCELPVPRAMQERLEAIIAGFGCKPPSPDYLRLLSADIAGGGPSKVSELKLYRARNRKFESISLHQRVCKPPVPLGLRVPVIVIGHSGRR